MPPRSLKSITLSVAWPAFLLGLDPSTRIMCVSYADDLVRRHSVDTRRVMLSAWYQALFPGTVLAKQTETELETTAGGTRFGASIGGSVTGLGAEWIIIDDPHKPDEALSKLFREKVSTFYSTTLHSRLDDKQTGKIILVMQRLHEDDLAGHLLEQGGWTELMLQAEAEEDAEIPIGPNLVYRLGKGELLQPDREPQDVLDLQRATRVRPITWRSISSVRCPMSATC